MLEDCQQPEQNSLEGHDANAGLDAAGAQEAEVDQDNENQDDIESHGVT